MGEIRSFTLDETADTIEDSVMGIAPAPMYLH